ncbi:MAG: hemerythrin domain-containing protein [Myxococcales bacterium]|nr:hemerythrin domain-containing protein [Myxococcales bacterium]
MDIIKCIKADHDEAAALFGELARVAHDDRRTSDAMRLAVRLAVALKIHAHAEEKIVYEVMSGATPDLAAFSREGKYEHELLDLLLDRLLVQRPGPELVAILKVARHEFEHHARVEEEGELLPALAACLDPGRGLHLAHDFLYERRRIRPAIERLVGPAVRGTHDGLRTHHHRRW